MILTTFDAPSQVAFSAVEKMRKGGKIVYTNLKGASKDRVVFQTPAMHLPFGLSHFTDESTGQTSSTLDLSLRGADTDPKLAAFQASIEGLDDFLLQTAAANETQWFGTTGKGIDLIREFMRKLVKAPSNPAYSPTVKCKMLPTTVVFDTNRKETTAEALVKGCTVRCILELSSVWFVGKTFGVSLRVLQVAIVSCPATIDGFAFVDDEADEDKDADEEEEEEEKEEE